MVSFKFGALLSIVSLISSGLSVEFTPEQTTLLNNGEVLTLGDSLYATSQSGEIKSELKEHFEYLNTEPAKATEVVQEQRIARRAFAYANDCKGSFGGWEHDDLSARFTTAVGQFNRPSGQTATVATYVKGNHVMACVRLYCYNCKNTNDLRNLANEAWNHSKNNKCNVNETQGNGSPQCRCNLSYNWGSSCPGEGIYWS